LGVSAAPTEAARLVDYLGATRQPGAAWRSGTHTPLETGGAMISLDINGATHAVDADPATPLLYVLRDNLALNGAKFGCGLGQCGACSVIIDGEAAFSCTAAISGLAGRKIRTIESLGTLDKPGVLQRAFIAEQAAQCGYCIAGMIMRAQALLEKNPAPTDAEVRRHMLPNLCRCGTHMRILRAVRRAADELRAAAGSGRTG
jgi:aerobic-type carbon monoxide dehydrogenase small subunit (CoxS/CutS family)